MVSYFYGSYSCRCPGKDEVSYFQGIELADVSDEFIDVENHILTIALLYFYSVYKQREIYIVGLNFPMGAELSNPFAMSHGFPFALASACLSLAVKSIPTVTES